jgi:hypothetical protein
MKLTTSGNGLLGLKGKGQYTVVSLLRNKNGIEVLAYSNASEKKERNDYFM